MTTPVLGAYRVSVALIGLFVLAITLDGFVHSYAGLYAWGIDHGLRGFLALTFPGMIDLFILVGELGLFVLALEGVRTANWGWVDMAIAGGVATAGWGVSLALNVGHVGGAWTDQATAGIAPIASMLGLLVLLRTLHRFVTKLEADVSDEIPDPSRIEPAGQDPIERVINAVRDARADGVGAERIGKLFGGTRHYVDKLITPHATTDDPETTPRINGHDLAGAKGAP